MHCSCSLPTDKESKESKSQAAAKRSSSSSKKEVRDSCASNNSTTSFKPQHVGEGLSFELSKTHCPIVAFSGKATKDLDVCDVPSTTIHPTARRLHNGHARHHDNSRHAERMNEDLKSGTEPKQSRSRGASAVGIGLKP